MTEPFESADDLQIYWAFLWPPWIFTERLYHREGLELFSLRFQRNKQQNALALDSTDGKTG